MIKDGIFKCPNCSEEKLNYFTNYQMKIINNEERWIFYINDKSEDKRIVWAIENGTSITLSKVEEIWNGRDGATEELWNKTFKSTFQCYKCQYKPKNFKEFILKYNKSNSNPINNQINNNSQINELKNENMKLVEENMKLIEKNKKLTEENKKLTEENKKLIDENKKLIDEKNK